MHVNSGLSGCLHNSCHREERSDVAISRLFPALLFLEIAPQGYFDALRAWAPRLATQGSQ